MTLKEIILSALSVFLTGIATYLSVLFTTWISSKIKNEKLKRLADELAKLITDEVLYTQQVFVDELKNKDIFDKKAQEEALQVTIRRIENKLSDDMKEYIKTQSPLITDYLKEKVEATIYAVVKK